MNAPHVVARIASPYRDHVANALAPLRQGSRPERAAAIARAIVSLRGPRSPGAAGVHPGHVELAVAGDFVGLRAWRDDPLVPAPERVWWLRRITGTWPSLPASLARSPKTLDDLATLTPAQLAAALGLLGAVCVLHVVAEAGDQAVATMSARLDFGAEAAALVASPSLRLALGPARALAAHLNSLFAASATAVRRLAIEMVAAHLQSDDVRAQLVLRSAPDDAWWWQPRAELPAAPLVSWSAIVAVVAAARAKFPDGVPSSQ